MTISHLLYLSVTEVEAEVIDKVKYIEETKETMDKNTKKLAEISEDISGIQKGKKVLYLKAQISYQCVQYRGRSTVCLT